MKNQFLKKAIFFSFCLLTSAFLLHAQTPQGIPYQAIARNASGVAIANTAVKVRFSIRDSIATGPVRYQETHSPTTSALGLFSVNVGMGTVVTGSFSGINWGKNAKFLQVELDPAGGTSYTDLGTTQMMSVPYAMHSKTSEAIKMRISATGDTLYTGGGNYVIIPGISAANPSTGNPNWNGTTVSDIDGNVYNTVTIGSQVWMKENLKVSRYRNGDVIPTNLSDSQWGSSTSGVYSVYNNNSANNANFGKLYNWYAVADPRGLCPSGWHVFSDPELTVLINNLGGNGVAGGKMKAISNLWSSPNEGATDESGFSGLPNGSRFNTGSYNDINLFLSMWSSTTYSSNGAGYFVLGSSYSNINRDISGTKTFGFSVRCLKD